MRDKPISSRLIPWRVGDEVFGPKRESPRGEARLKSGAAGTREKTLEGVKPRRATHLWSV